MTKKSMPSICATPDCGRRVQWRSWCCTHYARWLKTGDASGPIKPLGPRGAGYKNKGGYIVASIGEAKKMFHILLAEKALGKPLPPGAQVHHIDENPSNNAPTNLVICPDAAYHKLLHQRQRAFAACGHYHWRKCQFCQQYDNPANLWTSRKKAAHRNCAAAARAAYYRANKESAHAI